MDRRLIGLLVEREVESRMSWSHFAAHSGVSRATLYRVKDGDPRVTQRVFRQIERALDLPYDALTSVGVHDWISLRNDGLSEELTAWLTGRASTHAKVAPNTQTNRSTRGSGRGGGRPPV